MKYIFNNQRNISQGKETPFFSYQIEKKNMCYTVDK